MFLFVYTQGQTPFSCSQLMVPGSRRFQPFAGFFKGKSASLFKVPKRIKVCNETQRMKMDCLLCSKPKFKCFVRCSSDAGDKGDHVTLLIGMAWWCV